MESIEAIERDFLRGHEQVVNAFNRLLAFRTPVIPVATDVRVELVDDPPTKPEAGLESS